jgi:hypothetical protein
VGATTYYTSTVHLRSPKLDGGAIKQTEGEPTLAADDMRALLGPPNTIEHHTNGEEHWIYLGIDERWGGVILALVVIPLPLCIPVGRERLTIVVHEGVVVDAVADLKAESIAWFGVIYTGVCGVAKIGAYTEPEEPISHVVRSRGLTWPLHADAR